MPTMALRAVCDAVSGRPCAQETERLVWIACAATAAAVLLAAWALRKPRSATMPIEARVRSPPNVVLLGAEQAGKTSVFLRLSMDVAPDTVTSQRVQSAAVAPSERTPALELVDVPGHARLRTAAQEHLDRANALVFCIDASAASRGGSESATAAAALSTMKRTDLQESLMESVDFLHDTLRALAERRAERDAPPPALLLLFTRADKSPLFVDRRHLGDEKRRAQLLARCRRGVETALASRRISRGMHTGAGRVTVEGIQEVADTRRSLWGRAHDSFLPVLRMLPFWLRTAQDGERIAPALHPTRFGHNVRAGAGHQQEVQADYVAPRARMAMDELLTHLDARIVAHGCAEWGLASVDRTASWQPGAGADSLADLYAFLRRLAP